MKNLIKISFVLACLYPFAYSYAEPNKKKLEECYSYCGEDDICITNCKNAFGKGGGGDDNEEECE